MSYGNFEKRKLLKLRYVKIQRLKITKLFWTTFKRRVTGNSGWEVNSVNHLFCFYPRMLHWFPLLRESWRLANQRSCSCSTFHHHGDIYKYKTSSVVYKMDEPTEKFTLYQTLQTRGAYGVEHFSIADKHFLAVAQFWDGTHQLDPVVFQWNGQRFVVFQKLPTKGAAHFKFFKLNSEKYLTVANYHDGSTYSTKSVIYKWNGVKFNKFQEIATEGAMGWTAFEINNVTYIAFANHYNSQQKYSVQSTVFKKTGDTLSNYSLFKLTGHLTSSQLILMVTHSSLLPATTLEAPTTLTRLFINGMLPSSFFSSLLLLVEPSLAILSRSAVIPSLVWPIITTAARNTTHSQLCSGPLEQSSSSTKRFPLMELMIWHHLSTKVTLIWLWQTTTIRSTT